MASLRPRVIPRVTENISLIAPAGARTMAVVGTAQWGNINTVFDIATLNNAIGVFGSDKADLTLIKAIDLATLNGASSIKAVRIVDGSEVKSSETFDGNTGAEADVLTFSALYYGTYGNNVSVTISANAITPTNRDILITDGVVRETFDNDGAGYTTNSSIKTAIEGNSSLIGTVAVKVGSESSNLVDATVGAVFLAGGDDGHDATTDADFTGAITGVLNLEDFDIFVAPRLDGDHVSVALQDTYFNTLKATLDTRAINEEKRAVVFGGVTKDETLAEIKTRTSSGKTLALVAPSIKYIPSYQDTEIILNGSFTACAYAGLVSSLGVGESATNKVLNVSPIIDETTNTLYYNKVEQNTLLNNRVVPVTIDSGSIKVIRSVTRESSISSVYFEQVITSSVNFVTDELQKILNTFKGKRNDIPTRNNMAVTSDSSLQTWKNDGVIQDFQNTVVTEGVSIDTADVSIAIKPSAALNFIILNLSISKLQ